VGRHRTHAHQGEEPFDEVVAAKELSLRLRGWAERGLELRNVVAKYPFERSHRFPGIQPNSGHRDYSRLSCGVEDTQTFSLLPLVLRFGRFWLLPRRPVGMRGLSGPFPISQRLAHIQTILRWSSCAETADGSGILVPCLQGPYFGVSFLLELVMTLHRQ
jgi:hypothetical protein